MNKIEQMHLDTMIVKDLQSAVRSAEITETVAIEFAKWCNTPNLEDIRQGNVVYVPSGNFYWHNHKKYTPKELFQEFLKTKWVDVDTRPKVSSPYEKGFVIDNPNYNKITIPKEEQKQHLIDIMKGDEELGLYDEPKQDYSGVHLRHCYQGEYEDGCKYGEDDCPAKPKEEPTMITDWLDEYGDPEIYKKVEKLAMDKLKSKWEHLYIFGYPQKPFPTNYENDLNNVKVGLYEGAKWQQEQFKNESTAGYIDRHIVEAMVETAIQKMYSEEEVKKLIIDFLFENGIGREVENVEKWLEQFKKK